MCFICGEMRYFCLKMYVQTHCHWRSYSAPRSLAGLGGGGNEREMKNEWKGGRKGCVRVRILYTSPGELSPSVPRFFKSPLTQHNVSNVLLPTYYYKPPLTEAVDYVLGCVCVSVCMSVCVPLIIIISNKQNISKSYERLWWNFWKKRGVAPGTNQIDYGDRLDSGSVFGTLSTAKVSEIFILAG